MGVRGNYAFGIVNRFSRARERALASSASAEMAVAEACALRLIPAVAPLRLLGFPLFSMLRS